MDAISCRLVSFVGEGSPDVGDNEDELPEIASSFLLRGDPFSVFALPRGAEPLKLLARPLNYPNDLLSYVGI